MARFPLKWTGGVNQLVDPAAIADDQCVSTKNAYPALDGTLDKREGVRAIGSLIHVSFAARPIALFVPDPALGLDFILHGTFQPAGSGEFLTIVRMDQTMTNVPPSTESVFRDPIANGLNGPASMVNYKGRVIGVFSGAEGFVQLNRGPAGDYYWTRVSFAWPANPATGVILQQQNEIPRPRCVGVYRGRLVFAHFGAGKGNWLVFGDRDVQAGWTTTDTTPPWAVIGDDVLADNGRHLELAAIQGEDIIGIREVSLSSVGSPLQTALIVRTSRHTIICTGEPAQTTDTEFSTPGGYIGTFEANKVNYECGMAGANAECETPFGLCWASGDDVWLMAGNTPVRMGGMISAALQEYPPALRPYWSMAYANGTVFLAVATAGSVNELTTRVHHWRLDLRQGPDKARWYGPQDYESLSDWGIAGGALALSIVARRNNLKDIIVGAVEVQGGVNTARAQVCFISYNEAQSGEDIPFPEIRSARVWSEFDNTAGVVIPVGSLVRPTALAHIGRLYVATVAGVPGINEPTWPDVDSAAVVDGGVTWDEIQDGAVWVRLPSWKTGSYYTNLMEVVFKDFTFGQAMRDKLVRFANVAAYFGSKALATLRIFLNQGATVRLLGPTTMGAESEADDETGLAVMDSSAAVGEYQARTMRPGAITGRSGADPLTAHNNMDTGQAGAGGVIRGRSIQPRFTDDDGIIIDATNDYISWVTWNPQPVPWPDLFIDFFEPYQVISAHIPNGRYATMDTLMTAIVTAMNMAQGDTMGGFLINLDPWSYESAFGANEFPYMTRFAFAFNTRLNHPSGFGPTIWDAQMAFLFGDIGSNDSTLAIVKNLGVTTSTVTVYPNRTKRLLALLGLNTSEEYLTEMGNYGFGVTFAAGGTLGLVGERSIPGYETTPLHINGSEIVPYKRPPIVSLSEVELEYYIKPGLPFSKRSR